MRRGHQLPDPQVRRTDSDELVVAPLVQAFVISSPTVRMVSVASNFA